MKNYKLIPKVTLLTLFVLGIAAVVMFFLGGSAGSLEVAGDYLDIPRFTDLFLFWNYFLFAAVALVTFGFVLVEFCKNWKVNRKKAITTLGVVLGFVALACLCWFMGSPEKIDILGYEGTDNQGAWAQLSDAVIYACYILVVGTIATMIWGIIRTKTLK